jgi:hypothetical protein
MDKKLLFIRGQHTNEKAAYEMAPGISELLKLRGWNVALEEVDERKTMYWQARQILEGKKITPHISLRPGYFRANKDPSLFVFNFHNYPASDEVRPEDFGDFGVSWGCSSIKYMGKPQFIKVSSNYDVVELPAVYGEEDAVIKKGLAAIDSLVKDSKARWYQDMSGNEAYCISVDIDATKNAGLASDAVNALCADSIEKEAREYFDEMEVEEDAFNKMIRSL